MAMNQASEKQNSNIGLSEKIEMRREIVKKITAVKKELALESAESHHLKCKIIKSNEEVNSLRISVQNEKDSGKTQSRYESQLKQYEEDAELLRDLRNKSDSHLSDLNKKLELLQDELLQNNFGVTLDEVISHQDDIRITQKKVSDLEEIIANQNTAAQESFEENDPVDSLMRKREELLADQALGEASKDDIKKIDAEIDDAVNETAISESKKIEKFQLARQTVSGLQRRLNVAKSNLSILENQTPEILDQFLMTEAKLEAEQYLNLANELIIKFKRLMALENIIAGIGLHQIPVLSVPSSKKLFLPAFKMQCFDNTSLEECSQGVMFTSRHDVNSRAQYTQKEKERLVSLGIQGL